MQIYMTEKYLHTHTTHAMKRLLVGGKCVRASSSRMHRNWHQIEKKVSWFEHLFIYVVFYYNNSAVWCCGSVITLFRHAWLVLQYSPFRRLHNQIQPILHYSTIHDAHKHTPNTHAHLQLHNFLFGYLHRHWINMQHLAGIECYAMFARFDCVLFRKTSSAWRRRVR